MKINISPPLLTKLNVLSSEYNIEIGGYLLGEVIDGEIFLQDIIIPNQRISQISVIIDSRSQIKLFKKYGDKCKKIIGHWHSHHSMGCFWSSVDIQNMNNIMGYKDFFIFMVSSNKNNLIKVCIKKPFNFDFDENILFVKNSRLKKLRTQINNLINKQTKEVEYE